MASFVLIGTNDTRDIRLPRLQEEGTAASRRPFEFPEALTSPGPQKENLALS